MCALFYGLYEITYADDVFLLMDLILAVFFETGSNASNIKEPELESGAEGCEKRTKTVANTREK